MVSKQGIGPKLVIIEGKEKGKVIPLKSGSLVFGRSKGDILVQDPRVSRSHVSITYDEAEGKVTFQDLKSLNGTLINGTISEKGELHDGDKLLLGNTLFDCQIAPPPEEKFEATVEPSVAEAPKAPAPKKKIVATEAHKAERRPPPSASDDDDEEESAQRGRPRPRATLLPDLRQAYEKIPPRVRYPVLGLLVLASLYSLFYKGIGSSAKSSRASMASELKVIRALTDDNRYDDAIAKTLELQKANPQNAELYELLGELYTAAHKTAFAIAAYQKAHTLPSVRPLVHVNLAKLYIQSSLTKEVGEEMAHIEKALKDEQPDKEFYYQAAQLFLAYKELNEPPEKILIIAKALENDLAKDEPLGYRIEAQLDLQLGHTQDAMSVLEKGRKLAPDDEWFLENTAFARLAMHDLRGATDMLEYWLKVHPSATKAMLVMAYLKFNEKDYAKAVPYLQRILQIAAAEPDEPHHPEALDLMGKIYTVQGQQQQAANFFRQACEAGFQQSCDAQKAMGGTPAGASAQPASQGTTQSNGGTNGNSAGASPSDAAPSPASVPPSTQGTNAPLPSGANRAAPAPQAKDDLFSPPSEPIPTSDQVPPPPPAPRR